MQPTVHAQDVRCVRSPAPAPVTPIRRPPPPVASAPEPSRAEILASVREIVRTGHPAILVESARACLLTIEAIERGAKVVSQAAELDPSEKARIAKAFGTGPQASRVTRDRYGCIIDVSGPLSLLPAEQLDEDNRRLATDKRRLSRAVVPVQQLAEPAAEGITSAQRRRLDESAARFGIGPKRPASTYDGREQVLDSCSPEEAAQRLAEIKRNGVR